MLKYFLKSFVVLLLSLLLATSSFGAVDFNGDADKINIGDQSTYDFDSGDFSIAALVAMDNVSNDFQMIIAKTDTSGGTTGWSLYWRGAAGGTDWTFLIRIVGGNYSALLDMTDRPANGEYHWVIGVFDDTADTMDIHVTNILTGVTESNQTTSITANPGSGSEPVVIGTRKNSTTVNFEGPIAEVYLYDKALTASERTRITGSFIKGIGLQIPNCVGAWLLDDRPTETGINGDVYADRSVSGHDGTGVDADNDSLNIGESVLSYADFSQYVNYTTAAAPTTRGQVIMMW